MEVMVFEEGLTDSYTSLQNVNLAEFAHKIIQSPEDYVFILSPDEWNEWLKLHIGMGRTLLETKTTDEKMHKLSDFATENNENPLSLISLVSANPEWGNSYKIGSLTPYALGDCYAIFYVKEGQAEERAEELKEEIIRFRGEQANKPPLS